MKGRKIVYNDKIDGKECEGVILDKIIKTESVSNPDGMGNHSKLERTVTKYLVQQTKPYEFLLEIFPNEIKRVIY
jgi:hypothetical protein